MKPDSTIIRTVWSIRFALALALTAALSPLAIAAELPQYDPEPLCLSTAIEKEQPSGVTARFDACVAAEQAAYDRLREAWPKLSAIAQTWCRQDAGARRLYTSLEVCTQKAPQSNQRPFRR